MGYPQRMGTSPIRQALRACSEEDAVALLGHALWAQAALADARGDVQEIAWSDTEASARVRAPVLVSMQRPCFDVLGANAAKILPLKIRQARCG